MEPVRTCLGCRQRADRSVLLRVVAIAGVVTVDRSARLQGRGAWVHPTLKCVENSIARKTFARALRVEGVLDTSALVQAVQTNTAVQQDNAVQQNNAVHQNTAAQ